MDRKTAPTIENLVGVAAIFSLVVGFIAILVAIIAFFSGDYSATGLSLIAAALGSGLFLIAVLKS
jgi:hypothetical protein